MKTKLRTIICIMLTALICLSLFACAKGSEDGNSTSEISNAAPQAPQTSDLGTNGGRDLESNDQQISQAGNDSSTQGNGEHYGTPPEEYYPYVFTTYEEFKEAFVSPSSKGYETLRENTEKRGAPYEKIVYGIEKNELPLLVPFLGEKPVDVKKIDNTRSGIYFYPKELYHIPWISYVFRYNKDPINQIVDIKISYLDVIDAPGLSSAESYLDAISILYPTAPTPYTGKTYDKIKALYEKDVVLADGSEVKVLFHEYTHTPKMWALFLSGDMLIDIRGTKEIFTDEFWKSFSLGEYKG